MDSKAKLNLRERNRKYYAEHRAIRLAQRHKYCEEHRAAVLESRRKSKAKHRDTIREYNRAYYLRHRDETLENMRRRIRIDGMYFGMVGMTHKQRQKFVDELNTKWPD